MASILLLVLNDSTLMLLENSVRDSATTLRNLINVYNHQVINAERNHFEVSLNQEL